MIVLGAIGERLYCAIFVDREVARRIINLRKASQEESNKLLRKTLTRPTDSEDAQITAAALSDPDNLPLIDAELSKFKRMRGRPLGSGKKLLNTIIYLY